MGGPQKRKSVYEELKKKDIHTQIHYIPVYWQPYYKNKYGFKPGMCPAAEAYYSGCLSLPLYPAIRDRDVDRVIETVRKALA